MDEERAFLNNLNKIKPPNSWSEFAKSHLPHVRIWLVDDIKLERSIRVFEDAAKKDRVFRRHYIYINARGTYWKNYQKLFPSFIDSYEDTVVMRFLHELGHCVLHQTGNVEIKITERGVRIPNTHPLEDPREREAWAFALRVKQENPDIYNTLSSDFKAWYVQYQFKNKDW